jgi:putative nucleotidyltransferase with HDIG domain
MKAFDEKRLAHSLAVAEKLYGLAKDKGIEENIARELFTLGFLHDIGYNFTNEKSEHESVGGELLRAVGYKYWKEVYQHGKPNIENPSEELDMLNYADMTTGRGGENVSLEERLKEIGERYGRGSEDYREAEEVVRRLREEVRRKAVFFQSYEKLS